MLAIVCDEGSSLVRLFKQILCDEDEDLSSVSPEILALFEDLDITTDESDNDENINEKDPGITVDEIALIKDDVQKQSYTNTLLLKSSQNQTQTVNQTQPNHSYVGDDNDHYDLNLGQPIKDLKINLGKNNT